MKGTECTVGIEELSPSPDTVLPVDGRSEAVDGLPADRKSFTSSLSWNVSDFLSPVCFLASLSSFNLSILFLVRLIAPLSLSRFEGLASFELEWSILSRSSFIVAVQSGL